MSEDKGEAESILFSNCLYLLWISDFFWLRL